MVCFWDERALAVNANGVTGIWSFLISGWEAVLAFILLGQRSDDAWKLENLMLLVQRASMET